MNKDNGEPTDNSPNGNDSGKDAEINSDNDTEEELSFEPTESVEESDSNGKSKSLNRKLAATIPGATVQLFMFGISAVGFIIGAVVLGGFITGFLCLFEVINETMQSLGALEAGGEVAIIDQIEQQFMGCMQRSALSPIGLLSGLVGGFIGAYPAYKIARKLSRGELLRSII